jgi:hypothetical protein
MFFIFKMAVQINTMFLDDRVIFNYKIRQFDGIQDEEGRIELEYSNIDKLPLLPETRTIPRNFNEQIEQVYIPFINRTVYFLVLFWIENSSGNEYILNHIPFIKNKV